MENASVGTRSASAAEQEAFRARMEDQCRRIRDYRRSVIAMERRWLTLNEAAEEWIREYAGEYAERHPLGAG